MISDNKFIIDFLGKVYEKTINYSWGGVCFGWDC